MATQRLGPPWLGGALLVLGLAVFVAAAFAQASLALCLGALALSIAGFTRCALAHLRRPASTTTPSRRALMLLLTCAAAARLLCAASPPVLSDDLYRYVWDGRVQAAGINPYLHAPAAGALHALRDTEVHPRVNHPDVRTIYPPLAQILFVAARAPFDSPVGL